MSKGKTIKEITDRSLCTGCGTCVALCPSSAIKLIKDNSRGLYLPSIDDEACNQCGICLDVCPGHSVDFRELNKDVFGKEPEDILLGNYLGCYIGHATDYEIRYNSASGGLVTALLIFALEEGMIDGALATRMKRDNPLEPEPFIARTKEEIISAAKSKYCPVPANITLREILARDGKYAVVGLPCHIQAVRKAEGINGRLKERIGLHFGLVCNHMPTFLATEYLLRKVGVSKGQVSKINYRGEGWPGQMTIALKSGVTKLVPFFSKLYWGIAYQDFFYPTRCTMCVDKICELADISFMD
ncbi:MAG: coenzyme F420 hydrogenase/dehydrogenase beta subunit N-terminal domain-containing protein, partial [Chloroflexota bacterium]|nr:coenzyme F420 hydrogenase/dehydrogenase beta subunit N-terminal domain-containing protein [Chloroflexota bacterium]